MLHRNLFPRDVFAELDRLQRDVQDLFGLSPSIRGSARGGFPALNIGSTPRSVEVYAFAPGIDPATLIAEVEKTGYGAAVPAPAHEHAHHAEPELESLRRRLIGAVALAVPVILLAMIPALQFPGWQWVSLALATPVVAWAAWPFHQAAWTNLRHGAVTMDTLISVGVIAAFAWSLYTFAFRYSRLSGIEAAAFVGVWSLVVLLPFEAGNIWTADVSVDGKYLVTACDDSAVSLWNLETFKEEF